MYQIDAFSGGPSLFCFFNFLRPVCSKFKKLLNQIVRFTHVKEKGIAMASFHIFYADA